MPRNLPRLAHLTLLACSGAAAAQTPPPPIFTDVGIIPGGNFSYLYGVSRDGTVAVGYGLVATGSRAIRWKRETGLANMGAPSGASGSWARDVSADGAVVVGFLTTSSGQRAFRWTGGSFTNLGLLPGRFSSNANSVSDDGSIVVGLCDHLGFRWTSAAGMTALTIPPGYQQVRPEDISGDGQVIVGMMIPEGSNEGRAFRLSDGSYLDLGLPPGGYTWARAYATNADGWVVVGSSGVGNDPSTWRPFRWKLVGGGPEILGALPGAVDSTAYAVNDDGTVVVGWCSFPAPDPTRATIWSETAGLQDLNEVLTGMGVDLGGFTLKVAESISGDGTIIVGRGSGASGDRGFVVDLNRDTDGDGLKDHWEILGVPYINDLGQPRRLHLPGANPGHKDLYVEIDCMAGVDISQAAIDQVVFAFADAPLANPDGITGVDLHVLKDELDLAHIPVWQTDGCWPTTFDTYYNAHFGTDADRAANGGGGAGVLFRTARSLAYRYGLVADHSEPSIGGCGGIPDDQFVLFLGGMPDHRHASVFMHELGHNLGLGHGGGDDLNGKPNYPSVMNYVLAYRYPWCEAFWRLDYSRAGEVSMGNLNETSLDETGGVGIAGGEYSGFFMPFGISTAGGGREFRFVRLDGSPVDFGSTSGNMIPDGQFTTGVAQDLNYLPSPPPGINLPGTASPGQMLQAHDDWAAIVLATPEARGPGAPAPVYPMHELTTVAAEWIAQNFPIPGGGPPPCYANCDASTTAPVLNVADFTCFLQRFAAGESYANCDQSTQAPTLNVADFTCFLQGFAAGCP